MHDPIEKIFLKIDDVFKCIAGLDKKIGELDVKMNGLATQTYLAQEIDSLHLWCIDRFTKDIKSHENEKHGKISDSPPSIKVTLPMKMVIGASSFGGGGVLFYYLLSWLVGTGK